MYPLLIGHLVQINKTLYILGHTQSSREVDASGPVNLESSLKQVFGDLFCVLGYLSDDADRPVFFFSYNTRTREPFPARIPEESILHSITHIAILHNGRTCITVESPASTNGDEAFDVIEFKDFDAFKHWCTHSLENTSKTDEINTSPFIFSRHTIRGVVKELVAGATSFALLVKNGAIFTWGDGRFTRALGRKPTLDSPPGKPARLEALDGVAISRIRGCGWLFGALDDEGLVYAWGTGPPGGEPCCVPTPCEEDAVGMVECGDELRVAAFGVGRNHFVVVDRTGKVFAIGDNDNGQLGIGSKESSSTWCEVDVSGINGQIVDVECGAKCTWVLVKENEVAT